MTDKRRMSNDEGQKADKRRILNIEQGISKSEVEIAAPSTSLRAKGFFGSASLAMTF